MPEQDEADLQSGSPPAQPQGESFQPNDAAQPTELQSPEGELPPEAEQPDGVPPIQVADADDTPPDGAQPTQVADADDTPPDGAQPVEAAILEDAPPEQVVPPPRQYSRRERETFERQNRRFAACGRCGYFVADCRNYLGEEALQTAMLDGDDGWLRLEGDETFRRLLAYAYGIQIDVGYDYFDGSCPECRRRFVYMERGEQPARLKIQI